MVTDQFSECPADILKNWGLIQAGRPSGLVSIAPIWARLGASQGLGVGGAIGGWGVLRGAGSRHPTLPKSTAPEHEVSFCDNQHCNQDDGDGGGDYDDEVCGQDGNQER